MNNIENEIAKLTELKFQIKETQETISNIKNKINDSNKDTIKIITGGAIITTTAITTLAINNLINTNNAFLITAFSTTAITAFSTAITLATKIDNDKLNNQLKIEEHNLQYLTIKYYQTKLKIKSNLNQYQNLNTSTSQITNNQTYKLPPKKQKLTLNQQKIHEYQIH